MAFSPSVCEIIQTHQLKKCLKRSNVNVNAFDQIGWTALHYAAHGKKLENCQLLLNRGADPRLGTRPGDTLPLHYISRTIPSDPAENIQLFIVMEMMVDKGADVNQVNKEGETPLHTAVYKKAEQATLYLLKRKAQVNVTSVRGKTPLEYAIDNNSPQLVKILLHFGARSMNGANYLELAKKLKREEIAQILGSWDPKKDRTAELAKLSEPYNTFMSSYSSTVNSLFPLVENDGTLEQIKHFCKKNKTLNLTDTDVNGWTVLHCAANKRRLDVCKFLLKIGADPRIPSKRGSSSENIPLHYVARIKLDNSNENNLLRDVIEMMIEKGAPVSFTNKQGITPLHEAALNQADGAALFLLEKHADVNIKSKRGFTPLHYAICYDCEKIVRFILEKQADADYSFALEFALNEKKDNMASFIRKLQQERLAARANPFASLSTNFFASFQNFENLSQVALTWIKRNEFPTEWPEMEKPLDYLPKLFEEDSHFFFETGTAKCKSEVEWKEVEGLDRDKAWYKDILYSRCHHNYWGQTKEFGPVLVSVEQTSEKDGALVLFRTKYRDERFLINGSLEQGFKQLLSNNPTIPSLKFSKIQIDGELCDQLLTFEKKQIVKTFKFGVHYVCGDQSEENQFFSNTKTSDEFDEFLKLLGDKISLIGWNGYRGGLSNTSDITGTHSIYTKVNNFEIMYHVCTLLPFSDSDPQQLERKRHIGNDVVVVVFTESSKPFSPKNIKSQFNHVFILVRPITTAEGEKKYYVSISYKPGVRPCRPYLPSPPIFNRDESFRQWILLKLINAERAAMYAPDFVSVVSMARGFMLTDMVSEASGGKTSSRASFSERLRK